MQGNEVVVDEVFTLYETCSLLWENINFDQKHIKRGHWKNISFATPIKKKTFCKLSNIIIS